MEAIYAVWWKFLFYFRPILGATKPMSIHGVFASTRGGSRISGKGFICIKERGFALMILSFS